jgi:hypothetical protein
MMTPDQLKRSGTRHLLETIRGYYPNQAELNLWDGLKEEHFHHLPIYDWVEWLQDSVPYLKDYFDHPEEDSYWHQLNVRRQADQVSVPIFHLASWYDGFLEGGLSYFSSIRQHGMTAEARAAQRLMVFIPTMRLLRKLVNSISGRRLWCGWEILPSAGSITGSKVSIPGLPRRSPSVSL